MTIGGGFRVVVPPDAGPSRSKPHRWRRSPSPSEPMAEALLAFLEGLLRPPHEASSLLPLAHDVRRGSRQRRTRADTACRSGAWTPSGAPWLLTLLRGRRSAPRACTGPGGSIKLEGPPRRADRTPRFPQYGELSASTMLGNYSQQDAMGIAPQGPPRLRSPSAGSPRPAWASPSTPAFSGANPGEDVARAMSVPASTCCPSSRTWRWQAAARALERADGDARSCSRG